MIRASWVGVRFTVSADAAWGSTSGAASAATSDEARRNRRMCSPFPPLRAALQN